VKGQEGKKARGKENEKPAGRLPECNFAAQAQKAGVNALAGVNAP